MDVGFGERSIRSSGGWKETSRSCGGGHGKGESQFVWVGVVRGVCKVGVGIVISLGRAESEGVAGLHVWW